MAEILETQLQIMQGKQDEILLRLMTLENLVAGLQVTLEQLAAGLQAQPALPAPAEQPSPPQASERQFVRASSPLTWYRRHEIMAEDLAGRSEEEQYAMFVERFSGGSGETRFLARWAMAEYRKLTGAAYKPGEFELLAGGEEDEEDQLDIDLAKLRAIPKEKLVKPDGKVNQSEIARQLNLPTGGSKWEYVKELAAYLQDEYDQAEAA